MRIILLTLSLLLSACDLGTSSGDITGRWKGQDEKDGIMVFNKDGSFEILDANGLPLIKSEPKPVVTWETITEVEPFQLYITTSVGNETERIPLGIYKIENGKLILRGPITYYRTIGGFSMGVSRYEIPTDFSGVLQVFKKI